MIATTHYYTRATQATITHKQCFKVQKSCMLVVVKLVSIWLHCINPAKYPFTFAHMNLQSQCTI